VSRNVGVLALQGDYEPHARALRALGVEPVLVRRPAELAELSHLVLPGGESTTLHNLLTRFGMWESLRERYAAGSLALFGTCAGAILLGRDDGTRPPRLGLLDAVLERNAYGRQTDSFTRSIVLDALGGEAFPCIFIRAPKFAAIGPRARVLAHDGADPILVEGEDILAATFHPELSGDLRLHRRFLAMEPDSRLSGPASRHGGRALA
jgi:5'-phosphate synthase pdxT subunit